MSMKATLPAFLAAVLTLTACNGLVGRGDGDDNRFSAFADIPTSGWKYDSPIDFEPDTLLDSIVDRGRMLVSIRHGKDYLYRNLWLEVSYADAMGNWHGRGMGLSMEVLDTVPGNFPLAMHRAVRVRHIMRADTLFGIERVGIVYIPL